MTQPRRSPQPSPPLCCPRGGFSAPSGGAAPRSPAPGNKELFMGRPRAVHSGRFVRAAPAGRSPKKGSVCGEKGVPEAACPSLAVPKGPRHLFNPQLLSLRRGLAVLAVTGGAPGSVGRCTPLVLTAHPPDGCTGTARVLGGLGSCSFDQPCARLLSELLQGEVWTQGNTAPVIIPCSPVPGSPAVLSRHCQGS